VNAVPEGRQSLPRFGRDPEDLAPGELSGEGGLPEDRGQIGLVDRHDDVPVPVRRDDVPILLREGNASVQHDDHHVGRGRLLPDPLDALLLCRVLCRPDAGRVDVPHRDAPDGRTPLDVVPRGASRSPGSRPTGG